MDGMSYFSYITIPVSNTIVEKTIFGKEYVRLGKIYIVLGYSLFQQGGILGYFLRNKPDLLKKIVMPLDMNPEDKQLVFDHWVKRFSDQITSDLEKDKNEKKHFFYLYTIRELRNIGIDLIHNPDDKNLDKKVEDFLNVITDSFFKGIAFGLNFPDEFVLYWETSNGIKPDIAYQDWRKHFELTEEQKILSLGEAIEEMAKEMINWAREQASDIIDDQDIKSLEQIKTR